MSNLPVIDATGSAVDLEPQLIQHDPTRTLTLTGVSGTFSVGEALSFGTSGAAGVAVAWDAGASELQYFLTSATNVTTLDGVSIPIPPQDGETVTGPSGSGDIASQTFVGDTFINDGRTFLYFSNALESQVQVIAQAASACSQGFKHSAVMTVSAQATGVLGPFPRFQFNESGTRFIRFHYIGTSDAADFGVAATRLFKAQ